MVRDGDYISDEVGRFQRAEGSDELLQRVLWKLSIPRGSFPMLPELGSQLFQLGRSKPAQRAALARQYVTQALSDEENLEITGVTLSEDGAIAVALTWRGETLSVTVQTGGIG